jgi:hypothetical protein
MSNWRYGLQMLTPPSRAKRAAQRYRRRLPSDTSTVATDAAQRTALRALLGMCWIMLPYPLNTFFSDYAIEDATRSDP